MTSRTVTVERFLSHHSTELNLRVVSGHEWLQNKLSTSDVHRPGLALAGFFKIFAHERIQLLGDTEVSYLFNLTRRERQNRLRRMLRFPIPCVIITTQKEVPKELHEAFAKSKTPLLHTTFPTWRFVGRLMDCLERELAPSTIRHGELLDVYGMGLLILGESGVGKSEIALELIERGHRLVADDVVVLRRVSKNQIIGRSSENLRYHMEVRGLGIIDVERLFGTRAVTLEKEVSLIVQLEKWTAEKEYERLGLEIKTMTILDIDLSEYTIPVEPGRNVAVLLEVAALHQRLKNMGYNPAKRFDEELIRTMLQGRK